MKKLLLLSSLLLVGGVAQAHCCDPVEVKMDLLTPDGNKPIGTIRLEQTKYGMVLTPNLHGLTPGLHGFHIHINPSCDPLVKDGKTVLGGGAGGHFDPQKTGKHGYPWSDDAHLGDLPALYVDEHGDATNPVLAPRLKVGTVLGRSIMIHAHGDNHSDHPTPLGGGGARMACGVIPAQH